MSIDSLTPRLAAGQRAVHEALVVEKVFEAGAEAGLVVVPFQAVLLRLTHSDCRDINKAEEAFSIQRQRSANTWPEIGGADQGGRSEG